MRILVVQTSSGDRRLVKALRELDHVVEIGRAVETSPPAVATTPDCVILDLPAPSAGWAAMAAAAWPSAFHIQVVDNDDQTARIGALRAGTDACFARPLHMGELGGRLESANRRSRAAAADVPISLSRQERRLFVDGEPLTLSRREFLIVELLARKPGQVLTIEQIGDGIWGENEEYNPTHIRASISRLSSRIERDHGWRLIVGVRGRGYRLEPQRSASN